MPDGNPGTHEAATDSSRRGLGLVWISVGAACAVLAVILFFTPYGRIILTVFVGRRHIKRMETALREPNIYQPVAQRLASYCQSDQRLFPEYLSYAWLPTELAQIGHGRCTIATNYARVEMGGGFHHFGYRLDIDPTASTSATNIWQLFLYREGSRDDHLMTLALSKGARIEADELAKLILGNIDRELKDGNMDGYKSKVLVQLRFGRISDAAKTGQEWIRQQPDSWLARFTYAHLRCRLDDCDRASAEFANWVTEHQNFAHCVYLTLFHFREARTNDAVQAVRVALKQPFVEPPDTDGSKFYLGENAALIAYSAGDYDLCIAMCDKMLADSTVEPWARRSALRIKAAALFMTNDQTKALALMREAESFVQKDSFSAEGMLRVDTALRKAIENSESDFVRGLRNWADEMNKWFGPFETDETGVHGTASKIQTPYPTSWKSDNIGRLETTQ